ncbi:MAG: 50S ribosomal protein L25/general stress protein Ctc [Alphaproteobacteria bacterium 16-39-46]|nr:MAG: 50S ribosomal protein L25/general stress protein Ctc [Alphaproteobacteria bacterium 16-39-46]OZA44029.1 MAG: 50S ribosomal protein L25/general stress protein Ctc [Alphaproteobacteria bacterium 17-39-52]HQS84586.1 50S ribosomal protein L25/general stress protein Ctc [Alphaproteobacteria bacterium]HQS93428.1 50S ribosomal protein L25/general stress protein Ctc [Alphaproteobacteria bacterium]
MASVKTLTVETRSKGGTGPARATRRSGLIPGILYGTGIDPLMVAIDTKTLKLELQDPYYHTKLYDLKVGSTNHRALMRAVQLNPVTDIPIHVDFLRVDPSSRITVDILLKFVNDDKSPGIKRGGVLNIVYHDLQLSCPVDSIPEQITIDLSGLEVGQSIHLEDIKLPAGVQVVHSNRDYTLATIVAPSGLKSDSSETTDEQNATPTTEESK